jgi:hypothetical protein
MGADLSTTDLWQMAISWGRLGDLGESEIAARQLIAMAYGDRTAGVTGWTLMAKVELTRGSSGSAQRALEKALELDPGATVELDTLDPIQGPAEPETPATKAFDGIGRGEWMRVPRGPFHNDWRLARAQLAAARYDDGGALSPDHPLGREILVLTRGATDVDALLCRVAVLEQREAAIYGMDPPVPSPDVDSLSSFQAQWQAAVDAL